MDSNPILHLFSSQRNEMLIFVLCSTSNDQPGLSMDLNPIHHLSPAKKWNAHILIMFNFLWLAGLVNGLKPHPPLLSSQKKWNACFQITFTSDDLPGWLMNLNPICHPSPAKKMKSSFFDYVQLLMISQAGRWIQTPSATPLQPRKWNAHFCITFNFWCWPDWSMNSNPIYHPSPAKKMKCSFLDYIQLLMIFRVGWWTWKKMKCLFLDYVHFWWSAWLIDELKPHLPPLSYQKNEMLNFWLHSTSDDQPGW